MSLLNDVLYSLNKNPEKLAVTTETRLNNETVSNIDLCNYNFINDSVTSAGGAGIYISTDLNFITQSDIKFQMQLVESCWAEVETGSGKQKIIIGCIYRHPKAMLF